MELNRESGPKRPRPRRAPIAARAPSVCLLALGTLAGCCGRAREPEAGLGPAALLRRLREAHGVEAAWSLLAAVTFSFEVRAGGREPVAFPEVSFRLDDFRHLSVAGPNGRVELDLSEADEDLIGRLRSSGLLAPEGEEPSLPLRLPRAERDLAFSLRALPYLFSLPLATARGSWDFVGFVPPEGVEIPPALELRPREPPAPFQAVIVHVWPGERPLGQSVYLRAEGGRRVAYRAIFSEYEVVSGIRIARRRCHVLEVEGFRGAALDPFGWIASQVADGAGCDIEEKVGNIRFVAAGEGSPEAPNAREGG